MLSHKVDLTVYISVVNFLMECVCVCVSVRVYACVFGKELCGGLTVLHRNCVRVVEEIEKEPTNQW